MNKNTNILLIIIIAILLFGSGSVLGFFSTIFWIIVAIVVVVALIWFIASLPKIGKSIVEDEVNTVKESYKKHPTYTVIIWAIAIIFFAGLFIAWVSQSNNDRNNSMPTLDTSLNVAKPQTISPKPNHNTNFYPEANRTVFLSNCYRESENNISGCNCLLNYFEARYTLNEFAKIEAEYLKTQKYPKAMTDAANYCSEN